MGPTLDSRELIPKDTIKMTVVFSLTEIWGLRPKVGIELCIPSTGIKGMYQPCLAKEWLSS